MREKSKVLEVCAVVGSYNRRLLTSHQDGPNDAPSQDSALVLQRHLEVVERHQKHEQVVHASQRIDVVDIIKQIPGTGRGEKTSTGLVLGRRCDDSSGRWE